jgi:hypothetical protein
MTEMKKIIPEHGKMLRRIARDTRYMREAHSIEVAESILGTEDSSSSILSKLPIRSNASGRSSERHFESVILNTEVYSRAFNDTMKKTLDIESDDEKTVTDGAMTMHSDDSEDTLDSPSTKEGPVLAPELTTPKFAPLSDSVKRALSNLRIEKNRSWLFGELLFSKLQRVVFPETRVDRDITPIG